MGHIVLLLLACAIPFCAAGKAAAESFDAATFNSRSAGAVPAPPPAAAVDLPSNEDPDDPSTWADSRAPLKSDFDMQHAGQVDGTEHFQDLLMGYSILKAATTFDGWSYGTGKDQVVCTTFIKYSLLEYMTRLKYPARQIEYVRGLSEGAPEMREQIRTDIRMAEEAARRLAKLRELASPSEAQKKQMRNYEDMAGKVPFAQVRLDSREFQPGDVLFFNSRHVVFYVQPHKDGQRLGIYHAAGVDRDVTYSGIPIGFIARAFRLKAKSGDNI